MIIEGKGEKIAIHHGQKENLSRSLQKTIHIGGDFYAFSGMLRIAEIQGENFSVEEYMDWYAEERGNFTYFLNWTGFNFPSRILRPFYDGKFDPLTEKEKKLLELFRWLQGDFYIIGATWDTKKQDFEATVKHEFSHGLFYTEPGYRQKVVGELKKYNTFGLERALAKIGYGPSVYYDEMNAYLLTGVDSLEREGAPLADIVKLMAVAERVFEAYFGYVLRSVHLKKIISQMHLLRL